MGISHFWYWPAVLNVVVMLFHIAMYYALRAVIIRLRNASDRRM